MNISLDFRIHICYIMRIHYRKALSLYAPSLIKKEDIHMVQRDAQAELTVTMRIDVKVMADLVALMDVKGCLVGQRSNVAIIARELLTALRDKIVPEEERCTSVKEARKILLNLGMLSSLSEEEKNAQVERFRNALELNCIRKI